MLVLEAFIETDAVLPPVRVSRTRRLDEPVPFPVTGAMIMLTIEGREVPYEESEEPGTYQPIAGLDTVIARTGSEFRLVVRTSVDAAEASGRVPPALTSLDLAVNVPNEPVEAVLLDSLSLPLDSLQFKLPSRTGFVYPIVATTTWIGTGPGWWIATRLEPRLPFSSTLLDYFLRPAAVIDESGDDMPAAGPITWSGVYAVPVESDDSPVPEHDLVVTLVRGNADWAAYAASVGDSVRREPVSNVEGGIGIVAGVSIVRRTVRLP